MNEFEKTAKERILGLLDKDEIDWSTISLAAGGMADYQASTEKEKMTDDSRWIGFSDSFQMDGKIRKVGVYREMDGDGGYKVFFSNGRCNTTFSMSEEAAKFFSTNILRLLSPIPIKSIVPCKCGSKQIVAMIDDSHSRKFLHMECAKCGQHGSEVPVEDDLIHSIREALTLFYKKIAEEK